MKSTIIALKNCVIITFLLFTCAIGHSSQNDDKSLLEDRVNVFMQAKSDNKWDVVYDLLDSKFKNRISKDSFLRKSRGIFFGEYTIDHLKIADDGNSATVAIKRNFSMHGKRFENQPVKQRWTKEEQQWFKVGKTFEDAFSKQ